MSVVAPDIKLPVSQDNSLVSSYQDLNSSFGETQTRETYFNDIFFHFYNTPISYQYSDTTLEFNALKAEWKQEIKYLSSITDISMHPAYQRIIGMGKPAISLILKDLEKEPNHWFWALKAISGDDPVPPEHRGKMKLMRVCWLSWGQQNNYI